MFRLDTHSPPHKQVPVQEQGAGVRVGAVVVMLGQCIQCCVLRTPIVHVAEAEAARTAFGVGANEDEDESADVVHAADED